MNALKRFFGLFRRKKSPVADMQAILKDLPDGWLRSRLEQLTLSAELYNLPPLTIETVEWVKAMAATLAPDDKDNWPYPPGWQEKMRRHAEKHGRRAGE